MPTNGELLERVAELEAELRVCEDTEPTGQAARVRELEGLLASTTRQLEACQRDLADALSELEREPDTFDLTADVVPHVAAVEAAIERLAGAVTNAGGESELWQHTEQSETRLAELTDAIRTLSQAHQAISPKPLPIPMPPGR